MPYIEKWRRDEFRPYIGSLIGTINTLGELNYVITKIVLGWWVKSKSYAHIAEITGVLENVKQEFYRRVAIPYEENKKCSHGDVYE